MWSKVKSCCFLWKCIPLCLYSTYSNKDNWPITFLLFEAFKVKKCDRQTEEPSARQEDEGRNGLIDSCFITVDYIFPVRVQWWMSQGYQREDTQGMTDKEVEGETKVKSTDNPAQTQSIDSNWDWTTQKYTNTCDSNTVQGLSFYCFHSFVDICRYIAAAKSAVTVCERTLIR